MVRNRHQRFLEELNTKGRRNNIGGMFRLREPKINKWIILVAGVVSFFISCALVFVSYLNEDYIPFHTLEKKVNEHVNSGGNEMKSKLRIPINEMEHESIARSFIKLYSFHIRPSDQSSPWQLLEHITSTNQIGPESSIQLGGLLFELNQAHIVHADVAKKGTQLKLMFKLENQFTAVFKPMWYSRAHVIQGLPYDGHDRHNGEIAAYHISRILNMKRAPPVVGRMLNLQQDILPVSTKRLKKTFFIRNETDTCFLGECIYCKTEDDAVCGKGVMMEGAMVLWLPGNYTLDHHRHPWSRTYNLHRKAKWEFTNTNVNYCNLVREIPMYQSAFGMKRWFTKFFRPLPAKPTNQIDRLIFVIWGSMPVNHIKNHLLKALITIFSNLTYSLFPSDDGECYIEVPIGGEEFTGSLLLDIIDTSIFDYIIGNADRHHFELFHEDVNSILILIDNAKSFGNPNIDEESILAPLLQCKMLRRTTAERLNSLKQGTMMRILKAVLASDPLAPLLTNQHLIAVNRRIDNVVAHLISDDYQYI